MLDTRGLVIGELAVRENLLTRAQLEDLVVEQHRNGFTQPLGALMLEKRCITREQLDTLLRRQKQAIADYERSLSVSGLFGRIAIELGFLDERRLADAVRRQLALDAEGRHVKIGQILLRQKAITPAQFWQIIRSQGDFRCGQCGRVLDRPAIDDAAVRCDGCGGRVVSVDGE